MCAVKLNHCAIAELDAFDVTYFQPQSHISHIVNIRFCGQAGRVWCGGGALSTAPLTEEKNPAQR